MQKSTEPLENFENISNVTYEISNWDSQQHGNPAIPSLPMEIIIDIISLLDDIYDLHNCMLISKEIHDLIFRTPKIMRKVVVNFSDCNWDDMPLDVKNVEGTEDKEVKLAAEPHLEFLENRGKFFRCVKVNKINDETLKLILNRLPELEDLDSEIINSDSEIQEIQDPCESPPDLSKLKSLKISNDGLHSLTKLTKNAKNLQSLTVTSPKTRSQEVLTDFLVQQNNLQEFNMRLNTAMDIINFPTRDITKEAKFRIKKLRLCFVNSNRNNFIDFLVSQADSLEELELNYRPNVEILDVIFTFCTKLSKLTLNSHSDSPVFSDLHTDWVLPKLRKYGNKSFSSVQLKKIFMRFSNLESLTAFKLVDSPEVFSKLKTLEVGLLYYHEMANLKLPGLKDLTIICLCGVRIEENFIRFAKNVKNVENVTIKDFQEEQEVEIVVKNLNAFENLKTFKLGCLKRIGYASVTGDVLLSYKDQQFFNLFIDVDKKLIKYSKFIAIKFPNIFDDLIENFGGYELVECNVRRRSMVEMDGTSQKLSIIPPQPQQKATYAYRVKTEKDKTTKTDCEESK